MLPIPTLWRSLLLGPIAAALVACATLPGNQTATVAGALAKDSPCDKAFVRMNDWARGTLPPISTEDRNELQRLAQATESACAELATASTGLTQADVALAAAYVRQGRFSDAFELLQDAPQQESAEALMILANLVGQGRGIDKDPERAAQLLLRAASVGGPDFQRQAARAFLVGASVERNPQQALALYQSAVEQGSEVAMLAYATEYLGLFNPKSQPAQMQQALALVERAANELNSGEAMAMLARFYVSELGRDLNLAEQWADKALTTDNIRAYQAKGLVAFTQFQRIARDNRELTDYSQVPEGIAAIKWFRQGAEAGDSESAVHLGELYAVGVIVPKDWAEAERWLVMARNNGNRRAAALLRELKKAQAEAASSSS